MTRFTSGESRIIRSDPRSGLAALEAAGVDGFWIHLDADVMEDGVMPAVDYRMPNGLSVDESTDVLRVVSRRRSRQDWK